MSAYASTAESLGALQDAIVAGLALLEPPPVLSVSEWADRNAVLPKESSPQPGPWNTAVAEYQRELMDAGSDPAIERIVAMWPAQSGKTACLLNICWYYTEHDPSPILMVQPTLETAEAFSKERIAPAIRDTPALSPLFGDPRSRDSGNTLLLKEFPGGGLALAGANSPAGLASRSRRIVIGDEVDKWEASAGAEGDPGRLMIERTNTFWNRKIIFTSTPSIKGASRIEREYEKSDQRRYFVRCPHCEEEQVFAWGNLKWPSPRPDNNVTEHRPEECYYVCSVNGCEILEAEKPEMVRRGRWKATAKSLDGRIAGFHLNGLYSPWVRWPELIRKWLDAQGNPMELQTFVNASLAETWETVGDRVESDVFRDRIHAYPEGVDAPAGVLVITAAVDVQKDRLEASSVGWGMNGESWAIEHRVFAGDPALPAVWEELDRWLYSEYRHESGIHLRIRCTLIDTGYLAKTVYAFTQPRQSRRIYACKGRGGSHALLARPSKQGVSKALLYMVGVDAAKEYFYTQLKVENEGPGYCHFPDRPAMFDQEYFDQLTAEQLVTVSPKNAPAYKVWQKRRPRNEALDLRVYAMAALERIRPNFLKLRGQLRDVQRRAVEPQPETEVPLEPGLLEQYEAKQVELRADHDAQQRKMQQAVRKLNRRRPGWATAW